MKERLIGLDGDLPDFVLGCDPGPERCAFALVRRDGDTLDVEALDYPAWQDLAASPTRALARVVPRTCAPFALAYEKVTSRYGAMPGATTYDTCRNSGVVMGAAVRANAEAVYALGTVDWRVALGGRSNLKDSEVRAELVRLLGEEADSRVTAVAKSLKKEYNLPKPIGCHLRDAVGVAVGAYLMSRRGTPVVAREVWRHGN